MRLLGLLTLFALGACSQADPATYAEQQWGACQAGLGNQQERAHACGEVILSPVVSPQRRAEALMTRGILRSQAGQQARAIADFGRALRIDAALARAYAERGLVHHNRGAYEQAIADYDAALRLQPGMTLAAERRQQSLNERAETQLSQLDALSQAIERNPDNPALWNSRCWERAVRGVELDFALSDCDRALLLNPNDANAHDSRGLVYLKRGDAQAALADYGEAVRLDPNQPHFLYGRGVARLRLGMIAEGQADLAAAQRAEPNLGNLYRSYGVEA